MGSGVTMACWFRLLIQDDSIDTDASVIRLIRDTFHAVITDFVRIKVASITLAAADTFAAVKNALIHSGSPPLFS